MNHPFFTKRISSWDAVYKREVTPPFVPILKDPTDTSLFEKEFTSMRVDSPPEKNDCEISRHDVNNLYAVTDDLFESFHFSEKVEKATSFTSNDSFLLTNAQVEAETYEF
jgi:hypothetical protein